MKVDEDNNSETRVGEEIESESESWESSRESSMNESDTISLGDCSIQQMSGGETAALESNLRNFLKEANTSAMSLQSITSVSKEMHSESKREAMSESNTADLETNLQDLLLMASSGESSSQRNFMKKFDMSVEKSPSICSKNTKAVLNTKEFTQYQPRGSISMESHTIHLEGNINGLLGNVAREETELDYKGSESVSKLSQHSICYESFTSSVDHDESELKNKQSSSKFPLKGTKHDCSVSDTVGLEVNLKELMKSASLGVKEAGSSGVVEICDATSSTNSELIFDRSYINSNSIRSSGIQPSANDDEDKSESLKNLQNSDISSESQTVELEVNLRSLVDTAASKQSKFLAKDISLDGNSSISIIEEAVTLDNNPKDCLDHMNENMNENVLCKTNTDHLEKSTEIKTIDLESNLQDLIHSMSSKESSTSSSVCSKSSKSLSFQSNSNRYKNRTTPNIVSNADHGDEYGDDDSISISSTNMNENSNSLTDCSISDTVGLEGNLQGLLHNLSSTPFKAPCSKVDHNATTILSYELLGSDDNCSNTKSLKYSISEDASTHQSNLHGLINSVDENNPKESESKQIKDTRQKDGCRMSLIPQENLSITEDGFDSYCNENFDQDHPQAIGLNLRWEELMDTAQRHFGEQTDYNNAPTILPELIQSALSQSNYNNLKEKITTFLSNVCEKMERDAAQDNDDIDDVFAEFMLNYSDQMVTMQEILRGQAIETLRIDMIELLQTSNDIIHKNTMLDFNEWEMQVVNALVARIKSKDSNHDYEGTEIHRKLTLAENLRKSLENLSEKAIKKARRKSLHRRKVMVSLESHIE